MFVWLLIVALLVAGLAVLLQGDGGTIAGLEAGSFVGLVAGGCLLLYLAASIGGSYRGRIGSAVKDVAIWIAVALALVAGYGYRDEINLVVRRVAGELLPPGETFAVESTAQGERAVRIRRRPNGHFVAKAEVDGGTVTMLVDTGASTVVLTPADARSVGIDVDRLRYTVAVQTANGTAYAAPVRLRHVAVGPIVLDSVEALVAKPGALRESLLGMNFLRRLRSYEFSGEYLTLRS